MACGRPAQDALETAVGVRDIAVIQGLAVEVIHDRPVLLVGRALYEPLPQGIAAMVAAPAAHVALSAGDELAPPVLARQGGR
jgi:hypothetical protein